MNQSDPNLARELVALGAWDPTTRLGGALRLYCCALILVLPFVEQLSARDLIARNDSLSSGQNGYIQAGFVNGDIGAAVFELPCAFFPLRIKEVHVYCRSNSGTAMQVMTHLRVYPNGGPNPGSATYSAEGVVLTPGYLNQIRVPTTTWFLDHGPFTVGIQYVSDLEQPVGTSSAHLTTDSDGCESGRNLVYNSSSGQWLDACAAGTSGDFVIRVVFEPLTNGCFGDTDCNADVSLADFAAFQRCYVGSGSSATLACQQFDCNGDGDVDFADFLALAGCLRGPGIACEPDCAGCASLETDTGATGVPALDTLSAAELLGALAGLHAMQTKRAAGHDGERWTLVQFIALIFFVVLAACVIGQCWSSACRYNRALAFEAEAENPTEDEQVRINAGLDWLLYCGDDQATECAVWYDLHLARESTWSGEIRVNHWVDRQGFAARRTGPGVIVTVHENYVTGPDYSPDLLGLLLFAEWQHIDGCGGERQCEQALRAFRQRTGMTNVHPEVQHGFGEGSGG